MKKEILLAISIIFALQFNAFSQFDEYQLRPKTESTYKVFDYPTISINYGTLSFFGDIGEEKAKLNVFGKFNDALRIAVSRRFGNYFGASVDAMFGSLSQTDNRADRHLNFYTDIQQYSLNFDFYFDNDKIINKSSRFSPFISVGLGLLYFDPKGDLLDKNGNEYHYWNDGTIRNQDFNAEFPELGDVLIKDYVFETRLDGNKNYKHNSLVIPVKVGANYKFSDAFEAGISASFVFTQTDYIDNLGYGNNSFGFFSGHNDAFLETSLTLKYNIGKKIISRGNEARYNGVDFAALVNEDSDFDSVSDFDDECPDTPAGVMVDEWGCPYDDDDDGVPNYRDNEINSIAGVDVDDFGVEITPESIEAKYIRDSLIMSGVIVLNKDTSITRNISYSKVIQSVARYRKGVVPNTIENSMIAKNDLNKSKIETIKIENNKVEDIVKTNINITTRPMKHYDSVVDSIYYSTHPDKNIENKILVENNSSIKKENKILVGENTNVVIADTKEIIANTENNLNQNKLVANTNNNFLVVNKEIKKVEKPKRNFKPDFVGSTEKIEGVIFRIQLGSSNKSTKQNYYSRKFKIEEPIFVDYFNDLYKYSVGSFKTYPEADAYKKSLKTKTKAEIFIVAFKDGERISVKEAKLIK
jgi:hypothetical protein